MNSYDFAGQTAVIAGAGQGIGLTVAERMLASGAQVAIWDRDARLLDGLAARLDPDRVMLQAVDIGDLTEVQAAKADVISRFGRNEVLTGNGKAFTDRLFGLRRRAAIGQHEFDLLCAELGIEHRLAPPMRPQSEPLSAIGPRTMASGRVERFNGRIEDILQNHRFQSG